MGYLLFLALRQLRSRPWQSTLLVASVSLGVAILTTALSLTNGFEKDLVERLLGTAPHVSVYEPLGGRLPAYEKEAERLRAIPGVRAVSPFVQGQGLMTTEAHRTVGVLVRGVDPVQEARHPAWRRYMVQGDLGIQTMGPGVVLGTAVARKLGLTLGDRVDLLTGVGKRHPLTVVGLFESGLYEFDAHIAFLKLDVARRALGFGPTVSGLGLTLDDAFAAKAVASDVTRKTQLAASPWMDQNRPLLDAMFLERVVIFIVILFIVLVAMMGIGSTMAMWVIEKNREIALLRALGTPARDTGRLFVLLGTLISATGVMLGSLGGVLLSTLLHWFPLKLAGEVYFLSRLPVDMQPRDFLLVGLATLALSPVASLMPAWRAIRLDPIEVIRRT
ncbi:MAG: ABC transporter permease [Candidatus Sericytochromatia bacterium]|nr:ABC transporter permease [Candidatus Sericytochromatia bacterium]